VFRLLYFVEFDLKDFFFAFAPIQNEMCAMFSIGFALEYLTPFIPILNTDTDTLTHTDTHKYIHIL